MKKILSLLFLVIFLGTIGVAQEDYSKKPETKDQDKINTLFQKGKNTKNPILAIFSDQSLPIRNSAEINMCFCLESTWELHLTTGSLSD